MVVTTHSHHSTLKAVEQLLPSIAAEADRMETERKVPAKICEAMEEAGCLTMGIPQELGGTELSQIEISRVLETLAYGDASVAWTAMVALGFNHFMSRFPTEVVKQVRADSPGLLIRGAVAPQGRATPVDGGYTVEGRWALGSGSYDNRYVMAMCIIMDGDKPQTSPDGGVVTRMALIPVSKVEFLNTWESVGLCATNSHDFVVKPVFVAKEWMASASAPDNFKLSATKFDFQMAVTLNHASVAVGIARGMLDDIIALSLKKRPARGGGKTLATDPQFAYDLGQLTTRLEAMRTLLEARLEENEELGQSDAPIKPIESARVCAAASYIQHECQNIVDAAFSLGGSTVCYLSTSAQRRWRDIRCLVQHFSASKTKFKQLGYDVLDQAQN